MINPNITINTSQPTAKHGNPGTQGYDGSSCGSSGGNGTPGEKGDNGNSAQNIFVDLIANDSEICNNYCLLIKIYCLILFYFYFFIL